MISPVVSLESRAKGLGVKKLELQKRFEETACSFVKSLSDRCFQSIC
jgi:hypothetical protein